jgi:hypothetical protein
MSIDRNMLTRHGADDPDYSKIQNGIFLEVSFL